MTVRKAIPALLTCGILLMPAAYSSPLFAASWWQAYEATKPKPVLHLTVAPDTKEGCTDLGSQSPPATHAVSLVRADGVAPLTFGKRDRLIIPDRPSLHLPKDFSIEVWCLPEVLDGYALLKKHSFGFPTFRKDKKVGWYLHNEARKDYGDTIDGIGRLGEWQHYCLTFDGKKLFVFYNGKQVYQRPLETKARVTDSPVLVGFSDGWAGKFQGKIGLARIYHRALPPARIQQSYERLKQKRPPLLSDHVVLEAPTVPRIEIEQALSFDGTSSFVRLARRSGFNPKRAILMGAWIRPTASAGPIVANGNAREAGYQLSLSGTDLVAVMVTTTGIHRIRADGCIAAGQWQNVGLAWDGRGAQLFKDGRPVGRPALVTGDLLPNTGPVLIGADAEKDGRHYKGQLAEVKLFDRCQATLANIPPEVGEELSLLALNDDPEGTLGPRSRHLAGQKEKRKPLLDFEDLAGWQAVSHRGLTTCTLIRSREQRLWGDYVAKIAFGTGEYQGNENEVRLVPPSPIEIPDEFDSINVWVYGQYWGRTQGVVIRAQLQDATGKRYEFDLSCNPRWIFWTGWYIAHRGLPRAFQPGTKLVALTLCKFAPKADQRIFLDSMRFYMKDRSAVPSSVPSWSELPFPTTPDTILPSLCSETEFRNRASRKQNQVSLFYEGKDETIEWRYEPKGGTLSDLQVVHDGATTFRPADGGGLVLEIAGKQYQPEDPAIKKRLLSLDVEGPAIKTKWRWQVGGKEFPVRLDMAAKQKSLIVDISAETDLVTEVRCGAYKGPAKFKLVKVPYLTIRNWLHDGGKPAIVCTDTFFLSAFLDWYNSDASELFAESRAVGPDKAIYNGGSAYITKSDGKRNPPRERIFLTVSKQFAEVLPNIPNPPSPYLEGTKDAFWITRPWYMTQSTYDAIRGGKQPGYFEQEYNFWRTVRSYGVKRLFIRRHVAVWRQYLPMNGDPYTLVATTDPRCGGDDKMAEWIRRCQEGLGYHVGLYTNYTLISPLSYDVWDEDLIAEDSNGEWQCGSLSSAMLKPSRALPLQQRFATILKKRFNPTCSYQDQITARPIWGCTDYDHRVEGAGKFSATFRVHGRLLDQERKIYGGPVLSEGLCQWMFAGLTDSNYAQTRGMEEPGLVDFQLLKIHPLENDCGGGITWTNPDRLVAYTIAHGAVGHRYVSGSPKKLLSTAYLRDLLKAYFMVQDVQQYYAGARVTRIRYDGVAGLVPTEEAIRTDAHKTGRLAVEYETGLNVYVNRSAEPWTVPSHIKGGLVLPTNGYSASVSGKFREYSALVKGHRVDFASGPSRIYCDARGVQTEFGPVKARYAYVLFREEDGVWLIPAPFQEKETVSFRLGQLGTRRRGRTEVIACDEGGKPIRPAEYQVEGGRLQIHVVPDAFKYRILPRK